MKAYRNRGNTALGWAVIVLAVLLCVEVARTGDLRPALIAASFAFAAIVFAWCFLLRPCVIAMPDGVLVLNPLETHFVPWHDIDHFRVYEQVVIMRFPGRGEPLRAWGVMTARVIRAVGARTHADTVAAELNAQLDQARQNARRAAGPPPRSA